MCQRPHLVSNLLRYFESNGRILEQQAPTRCLLHRTFDQHMRVTDGPCGQASFGHSLIHRLKIVHGGRHPQLFLYRVWASVDTCSLVQGDRPNSF